MTDEPDLKPSEAAILLNIEIRRRVTEALYETLVGDRPHPVRTEDLSDASLKTQLRVAMSVLIIDVLESPEFKRVQQDKEYQRQYEMMQMQRAQQHTYQNALQHRSYLSKGSDLPPNASWMPTTEELVQAHRAQSNLTNVAIDLPGPDSNTNTHSTRPPWYK